LDRTLMPKKENDSTYWRGRAAEARTKADQTSDSLAKRILLGIAASYDRIAESAERRECALKETDE
jgi:hypothetical protein